MAYVDKYLFIILIMLALGMAFAIVQNPPNLAFFYGQLAGAFIIIAYSTIKTRKSRKNAKKK
jgi:zinc transporter ZupT